MAVDGIAVANYLLTRLGNSYADEDCVKAVVVNPIRKLPGGDPSYRTAGCTELWNSINSSGKYKHITERMTLEEAQKEGLLIGDLPVIYNAATGKCEHIAYYMGGIGGYECIHSSASKGCICGTALKNGFTHVLRHKYIAGVPVGEMETEVDSMNVLYNVKVNTSGGGTLNLRKAASTSSAVLMEIPFGAVASVIEETSSKWLKVIYSGMTGYVSRPLVAMTDEVGDTAQSAVGGGTLRWGCFVICDNEDQALALAEHFCRAVACQREVDD